MHETIAGKWHSLSEKDKRKQLSMLPLKTRLLLVELVSYLKNETQASAKLFKFEDIRYTKDLFRAILGTSLIDVKSVWETKNPFQHPPGDENAINNFLVSWLEEKIIFDAILLYESGFLQTTFKEDLTKLDLFFKTEEGKFSSKHLSDLKTLGSNTENELKNVETKKLERLRLVLKRGKIISAKDKEELEIIASLSLEGIATAYVPIKNFDSPGLRRAFERRHLAWKTSKGLIYSLDCRNPKTKRLLKGTCILTLKGFRYFKPFLRSCYVWGCPNCTPILTQQGWEEKIREEQKEAKDANN